MAKYPTRRTEKDALYAQIVAGVTAHPADFPSGPGQPFALATLNTRITAKNTAVSAQADAQALAEVATDTANASYDSCDDEAIRLIDLAIATHGKGSSKLSFIGYGPIAPPSSNVPGPPRFLEAVIQGPGNVFLDWKGPSLVAGVGGGGEEPAFGKVSFYKVLRRKRTIPGVPVEDWGAWQATTVPSELMLTGLDRGVEYDFQVIAVNAAGESVPSNVVTVVL